MPSTQNKCQTDATFCHFPLVTSEHVFHLQRWQALQLTSHWTRGALRNLMKRLVGRFSCAAFLLFPRNSAGYQAGVCEDSGPKIGAVAHGMVRDQTGARAWPADMARDGRDRIRAVSAFETVQTL